MNISDSIDLTRPPFRLTISRRDDGNWESNLEANGVPLIVGVVAMLICVENGLGHMCSHCADMIPVIRELRDSILSHSDHTTEVIRNESHFHIRPDETGGNQR